MACVYMRGCRCEIREEWRFYDSKNPRYPRKELGIRECCENTERKRKSRGNEGWAKISLETYRSREIFRVVSGYDTRAKKEIEQHNPRFVAYLPWHESLTIRTNIKKTGNSFSATVHWKQIDMCTINSKIGFFFLY